MCARIGKVSRTCSEKQVCLEWSRQKASCLGKRAAGSKVCVGGKVRLLNRKNEHWRGNHLQINSPFLKTESFPKAWMTPEHRALALTCLLVREPSRGIVVLQRTVVECVGAILCMC